jgi:hypothetical protein
VVSDGWFQPFLRGNMMTCEAVALARANLNDFKVLALILGSCCRALDSPRNRD